jgi:hypothetical protein
VPAETKARCLCRRSCLQAAGLVELAVAGAVVGPGGQQVAVGVHGKIYATPERGPSGGGAQVT